MGARGIAIGIGHFVGVLRLVVFDALEMANLLRAKLGKTKPNGLAMNDELVAIATLVRTIECKVLHSIM